MTGKRLAPEVTAPHVVGLSFEDAQTIAHDAGLALAQPDPDGPPVGALAWQKNRVVCSQSPAAGTTLYLWDSLVVWFEDVKGAEPAGEPAPRIAHASVAVDSDEVHELPSSATAS